MFLASWSVGVDMGRSAWKAKARAENTPEIVAFCEDNGLTWRYVAGDWHIRIENVLDVYPTRKRFCWLKTAEWGWYEDYEDLGRILTAGLQKLDMQLRGQ